MEDEVEEGDEDEVEKQESEVIRTTEKNERGGFHSFLPKVQGVLYKISPLSEPLSADIEKYMREGYVKRDLIFVGTVYGLVSPSQTKDFSMFWESPWIEDQILESGKKRRLEQQQRSLAVRSFIRANTNAAATAIQESEEDIDKFLSTVNRLTEWDANKQNEENNSRQSIKTVSRMVQSFEKKAVLSMINFLENNSSAIRNPTAMQNLTRVSGSSNTNNLLGNIECVAHSLRRATFTHMAFASLVAAELLLSEGTNGSRNTSINMSRRLDMEKFNALNTMIDVLQRANVQNFPRDSLGLPLMHTNCNVCISKGVLVVNGSSNQANYILDIEGLDDIIAVQKKRKDRASNVVMMLQINARIFEEEEAKQAIGQEKKSSTRKPKTTTKSPVPLSSLV